MKMQSKILQEKNEIEKLLKNKNFRNNQNYSISKYQGVKILETYNFSLRNLFGDNKIKSINFGLETHNIKFLEREYVKKAKKFLRRENNFIVNSIIFLLLLIWFYLFFAFQSYIVIFIYSILIFVSYKSGILSKIADLIKKYNKRDLEKYNKNYIFLRDRKGLYFYKK